MVFIPRPFPAIGEAVPNEYARALNDITGPFLDRNGTRYAVATPLERSRYSACPSCGDTFGFFRRKNNCVNCGQVVCSDCLESKWYLPKYGLKVPMPCCRMCNRNLHMSLKGKAGLGNCTVRELRAYLIAYGLYNPSTMIEKDDLVAAVYNNSPVPQINEQHYRDTLPQPSASAKSTQPQQQQQQQQQQQNSASAGDGGSSSTGRWDRMFSEIGNEIGRGVENLGQHLGSGIERGANILSDRMGNVRDSGTSSSYSSSSAQPFGNTSYAYSRPSDYDSRTYSHSYSRAQQNPPPFSQTQARQSPRRPRSAQGQSSQNNTQNQQMHTNMASTPRTADTTRGVAAQNATNTKVPDLKALVRDETDLSTLSVKALKMLLATHHVDYSNIVEKQELIQRVKRLVENTRLEMKGETEAANDGQDGRDANASEDDLCKICWDSVTNCVFLNCGHMCTCLECGDKILASSRRECPICREYITRVVHVFKA
ncbi:hypothetical protein H4R20_002318 [Coemansia guatemalensis]|uniref:RING-type domain-containing protein n=1 Tax=Coemansia guatemalensis TaxID=2761395 RepID=A0A9W8I081_9FUNG|nr:hypothetical protein H4R20_002318 [Coemansia guatemalensis]